MKRSAWRHINMRVGMCWLWTGAPSTQGYGIFRIKRDGRWRAMQAHKYMLEKKLGRPLRPGFNSLHTCDVKLCMRPDHLYEGTHAQNAQDAVVRGLHPQANKTHCPQGHAYTEDNTVRRRGYRECRACRNANSRAWRARQKGS